MRPGSIGKEKFDSKWENGVWLGVLDGSGEKVVGTPEGCIKVRSIRRKPEQERWNHDFMTTLRGVPWEVVPGHPDRDIKSRVIFDRERPLEGEPKTMDEPEEYIKRIYITKKDLDKYGRTEGCHGCRASLRGGESKPHNEECRKRIEEAMKNDAEGGGKDKWERNEERINEKIFRKIEENERSKEEEKVKRMRTRQENDEAQPSGEEVRKRAGDQDGEQEEWNLRRKRRGEDRQQEAPELSNNKRPAEEHAPEDQRESKAQVLEPQGISALWRTKDRDSWAWRIEGGLGERWRLRKGVILDLAPETKIERRGIWMTKTSGTP